MDEVSIYRNEGNFTFTRRKNHCNFLDAEFLKNEEKVDVFCLVNYFNYLFKFCLN